MSTTQEKQTYNGWTNYETWCCKLWMDNDQGSQEYWAENAREAQAHYVKNQYMTEDQRIVGALVNMLKADFEEQAEDWMRDKASFFADLMNASLSQVNWKEIAEALIDEQQDV